MRESVTRYTGYGWPDQETRDYWTSRPGYGEGAIDRASFKFRPPVQGRLRAAAERYRAMHSIPVTHNFWRNQPGYQEGKAKFMIRDITIKPVLNGFICQVGCQTIVIESKQTLVWMLSAYLDSPEQTEAQFLREATNARHVNGNVAAQDAEQERAYRHTAFPGDVASTSVGGSINTPAGRDYRDPREGSINRGTPVDGPLHR